MKEKLKALFVYFFGKKPDPAPEVKSETSNNVVWTAGDPATSIPVLIQETKVVDLPKKEPEWNGWAKTEQTASVEEKPVKKPLPKKTPAPKPAVKAPSNKPANKKPRNRVKKATPAKTS